jgi:hypothetical protein
VPAGATRTIGHPDYPEHFGNVEDLPLEGTPPLESFSIGLKYRHRAGKVRVIFEKPQV